jgi:hypothetical protein
VPHGDDNLTRSRQPSKEQGRSTQSNPEQLLLATERDIDGNDRRIRDVAPPPSGKRSLHSVDGFAPRRETPGAAR